MHRQDLCRNRGGTRVIARYSAGERAEKRYAGPGQGGAGTETGQNKGKRGSRPGAGQKDSRAETGPCQIETVGSITRAVRGENRAGQVQDRAEAELEQR